MQKFNFYVNYDETNKNHSARSNFLIQKSSARAPIFLYKNILFVLVKITLDFLQKE